MTYARAQMMLPDDGAPAAWDKDGAYRVSNVEVYYVERATPALPPRLTFLSEGDPAHFECHVRWVLLHCWVLDALVVPAYHACD